MLWSDIVEMLRVLKIISSKLQEVSAKLDAIASQIFETNFKTQARFDGAAVDLKYFEARLNERLARIEAALIPAEAARVLFFVFSDGIISEVSNMQMPVDKTLKLMIAPVDKAGNPAKVDGVPAWSLTDPALGVLAVEADGMSAVFTPAGALGSLMVQVNADADLGEGVKTIAGELPVEILAGEAVTVNMSGEVV